MLLEGFQSGSLREAVRKLEQRLAGLTKAEAPDRLGQLGVSMELLLAALLIKKQAGQINEIVHAIGILLALPHILEEGEIVKELSLAAGNTGKDFDLETNKRIAEFTFIRWQGGSYRPFEIWNDQLRELGTKSIVFCKQANQVFLRLIRTGRKTCGGSFI